MFDFSCPKCKTTASFQLYPGQVQTLCPNCKIQMRESIESHEFTDGKQTGDEINFECGQREHIWQKFQEKHGLNDFAWKKPQEDKDE